LILAGERSSLQTHIATTDLNPGQGKKINSTVSHPAVAPATLFCAYADGASGGSRHGRFYTRLQQWGELVEKLTRSAMIRSE